MANKQPKSKLVSFLTLDHVSRAQQYISEGNVEKAARLFERGKDFRRATRYYAESRNEKKAIETAVKAVLGPKAQAEPDASLRYAAELLVSVGGRREAVPLYELAGDYGLAAKSAAKSGQHLLAAQFYDRAKNWTKAAAYYEKVGKPREALRSLDREAHRLQAGQSGGSQHSQESLRIERYRGKLMALMGRSAQPGSAESGGALGAMSGKGLEQAGKYQEAMSAFLRSRDFDEALRLVREQPSMDDRLQADIFKQWGKPRQAAQTYGALGFNHEAALAWQDAGDWQKAALQWKKSRQPLKAAEAYLKSGKFAFAGDCFESAGNKEKALEAYRQAGEFAKVAHLQLRLGRKIEAAATYLKARKYMDAAKLLLDQGKKTEAVDVLRQVPATDASFDRANLLMAEILFEAGKLEEALHRVMLVTANVAAAGETGLDRLYWEGRIREGLGRETEARVCFEKLVALRADHRDAGHRLDDLRQRMETSYQESQVTVASVPVPPDTLGPTAPAIASSSASDSDGELAAGGVLADRYELIEELGRGGMGLVFKAYDRVLQESVAIKTLLQQMGLRNVEEARLLREVQICRKLTHPNVVRVHDIRRFRGGVFITMELLEGKSLDRFLVRHKPVSLKQARGVIAQVAAGLTEAHALRIVHRDLKPANLFVAGNRVKILDFGISRMPDVGSQLTQTGQILGSPHYMSPEQFQGQPVDGRSDLYSLGVITFRLLVGNEPFMGETLPEIMLGHLQKPPPELRDVRPDVPDMWSAFLAKMLAKDAADRFQSIGELREMLGQLPVEAG